MRIEAPPVDNEGRRGRGRFHSSSINGADRSTFTPRVSERIRVARLLSRPRICSGRSSISRARNRRNAPRAGSDCLAFVLARARVTNPSRRMEKTILSRRPKFQRLTHFGRDRGLIPFRQGGAGLDDIVHGDMVMHLHYRVKQQPSFPSCTWERTCPRSFAAFPVPTAPDTPPPDARM